jgi:hypothetical protein
MGMDFDDTLNDELDNPLFGDPLLIKKIPKLSVFTASDTLTKPGNLPSIRSHSSKEILDQIAA